MGADGIFSGVLATVRRRLRRAGWRARERLGAAGFDESFYLRVYPDVAAAVGEGDRYLTAYHHWVAAGMAEGRQPREVPTPPRSDPRVDLDLTRSPTVSWAFLELTTRCNLRCTYCPVSQPTYLNVDLEPERIDSLVEELVALDVQVVQMNGHGESTVVRGWEALADRLADRGLRLHLTTNLAKRLKPSEVAALSRFERITFSVDTADPELCAELRRGAKLERILENVKAIHDFASERRRPLELAVSTVVSEQTAPGIEELADVLLERGVRWFRFADLVEYPPVDGVLTARHVSNLDGELLEASRRGFRSALRRIADSGGAVEVDGPVAAVLRDEGASIGSDHRAPEVGAKSVRYEEASAGQTRDCLDPWTTAYLHAVGIVRPCCFFEEYLGIYKHDSLTDIFAGEGFTTLRESLLEGRLSASCASCSARPLVDVERFREKVADHLLSERRRVSPSEER